MPYPLGHGARYKMYATLAQSHEAHAIIELEEYLAVLPLLPQPSGT